MHPALQVFCVSALRALRKPANKSCRPLRPFCDIHQKMIYNHSMAYKAELEALVLGALQDGPLHGYRIAIAIKSKSEDALKMGDNQIYPTLHRLEHDGLVVAEWQPQVGKPSRKVYSLTASGTERLEHHRKEWGRYASSFSAVIGTGGVSHA